MKDNMPTIANFQMPDKIFDLIKDYSETDELNINYSFEGDWGNWNWLYNKIIEDFVHNNPDYHVIKKSDVSNSDLDAVSHYISALEHMIENDPSQQYCFPERSSDFWKGGYLNNLQSNYSALIAQSAPDMVRIPRKVLEGMKRNMRNPLRTSDKKEHQLWYQNGYDVGNNQAINDVLNYKEGE